MNLGKADKRMSSAERFAALSRVGTALMRELDEGRLLRLIAETACDLTGATFAAFSLRPTNEAGQFLVPSQGNLFQLAAVVGVTKEQEALFHQLPLGGEGLLAPIFRHGVSVLVPDALTHIADSTDTPIQDAAREAAFAYSHGQASSDALRSLGVPRGHPIVRSFLGAPLLDSDRQVRGGLLLGHSEPNRFTSEDETLLVGQTTQAAVALENARLYRTVQIRVEAERVAREQASHLEAIFEAISDSIFVYDGEGRIIQTNATAREFLSRVFPSDHLLSLQERFSQLFVTDQQGKALALKQWPGARALAGEVISPDHAIDISLSAFDGQLLHMSITGGPLHDANGHLIGAVIISRDVTERRRLQQIERDAHAEAKNRLALLQLILDELPGSVYLVRGEDARLVLANRTASKVWGAEWPQGQTLATFLKENSIRVIGIDGHSLETSQLATVQALHYGKAVYQHQESIQHPDGTSIPVLVNAVAVNAHDLYTSSAGATKASTDSAEPAAIVVHQDMTALKEAERLKDEFIGLAAHELRTPLAVLKGFAQTLILQTARGKGPELAVWQIEALQGIDQSTARMVELTEDLLDVTRLQAGRLALHREPRDLVPLFQRLVARMQMTTDRHRLSMHSTLAHLVANVDAGRIEQVFNNLLGNAIKYSLDGGAIEVRIRQEAEANMAILSIRDHGIGIPAHQHARIFSRFGRAENAQAYGIGGTGLGLYLCRELVERHDGRIWFESIEGQGSTFFVKLPLLAPELSASQDA